MPGKLVLIKIKNAKKKDEKLTQNSIRENTVVLIYLRKQTAYVYID
jgi:hypothetical protein